MIGYLILLTGLALIVISPIIKVIEQLVGGIYDMSDAQTQALADLASAITDALAQISTLVTANANIQPNDSALIEAQVARIRAALAPAPVTAPIAPAAPAAPAA